MFCPRCGTILKIKKQSGKNITYCSCGYTSKDLSSLKITERPAKQDDRLEVVDSTKENHLPKTNIQCPKCKHGIAYSWSLQTRGGDEAETKFFRCEKCNHTWREYD